MRTRTVQTTPYSTTTYWRQRRTWRRVVGVLAYAALLLGLYLAGVAIGGSGLFAPAQPTTNVWQYGA